MFTLLVGKFVPYMIRLALFADAISIPLLSFFLNFLLQRWRGQGLLNNYRIDLRRIRKSYYEFNLHLVFGPVQGRRLLADLITEVLSVLFGS